jgi:hypothetical protein
MVMLSKRCKSSHREVVGVFIRISNKQIQQKE